ncbi:Tetratricopeptide-like helical [Penicillium cf. griseofulvum]|uniref:Coatomer subunit epsilon n=1 Tax=Penicillium cf. griseofulvum TaxID=2972120 RepID=A0A9W9J1P9_9EURO|nr:Tetratricopeptide-like helical [Penicillium cf. griseofulvum]KAJ5434057.1 Tetratricopeptide-like helical [Penicillium cf. griseofulvum]KAJ5451889.1 Tetratricopeptide-like helical [Penicillium cf. griseofulvum]
MDPFSAEGELLNIHSAFHSGQYQNVIDFETSALSPENQLPAQVLRLRAQIALGQYEESLAEPSIEEDSPDLSAVRALALQSAGKTDAALQLAQELAENYPENNTVQVLAATVLQAQGHSEEALALLSKHQGNLEAVSLIVQIQLQQNRTDLALKEVQSAKRWAQDSLLVNVAESWVGLRVGGEKYQSAFYVYEELASAPGTSAPLSIVGQAISEIHLGRLPEAEAALTSALENYPTDVELIANSIVLNVLAGKQTEDLESRLQQVQPAHPLLTDIQEKSEFFDTAAAKFSAKVSS